MVRKPTPLHPATPTTDPCIFPLPTVTWDPSYFPANSTIFIHVNYVNNTGGSNPVYVSTSTANALGYVVVAMERNWLTGLPQNNLTIFLAQLDPMVGNRTFAQGPVVTLMEKPLSHFLPPPRTPPPNKISLLIGLPVSLAFIFLSVIILVWHVRRSRSAGFHGLRALVGKSRGYGGAKSRRQRLGLSKRKGNIRLAEEELAAADEQFRDEPLRGMAMQLGQRNPQHSRNQSLGSLVSESGGYSDAPRRNRQIPDERITFGVPRHHMD